jgi:hypothetical protein
MHDDEIHQREIEIVGSNQESCAGYALKNDPICFDLTRFRAESGFSRNFLVG